MVNLVKTSKIGVNPLSTGSVCFCTHPLGNLMPLFERELASLVALQVVSSKGEEEENFLTSFNKARLEA